MPCFDKKLEASREDFYNDVFSTRDVDCVVSTCKQIFWNPISLVERHGICLFFFLFLVEMEQMMESEGCDLLAEASADLDTMCVKIML